MPPHLSDTIGGTSLFPTRLLAKEQPLFGVNATLITLSLRYSLQVTEVLLRVNDDLNNAFLRFDRVERFLTISTASATPAQKPEKTVSAEAALIDFDSSDPTPAAGAAAPASASDLAAHLASVSISGVPVSNVSQLSSATGQGTYSLY